MVPTRIHPLLLALLALGIVDRLSSPHPQTTLAYVDPGLGTMLIQLAAASFFGLLFYIRSVRRSMSRWIGRLLGREVDLSGR